MPRDPVTLTFLRSTQGLQLTKTFTPEGSIPTPHAKEFSSVETQASTAVELYSLICRYNKMPGYAMFTGYFPEPLVNESRAGRHDSNFNPSWLCLDFDGLEGYSHSTAIEAMKTVCPELENTSYVLQYSASSGLKPGLRAHLFFLIDEPIDPGLIQQWLWSLNFKSDLSDKIELSNSMNALHMPLDPLLGQNSRIIFIASPIFKRLADPHPEDSPTPRIELVQKENDFLPGYIFEKITPLAQLDKLRLRKFNELGKKFELGNKRGQYLTQKLNRNPIPAKVTERKVQRGFVYVNLNNGDSWGYFYPEDNPEILYNFKGEPNYLLEKLDPIYYEQHYGSDNTDNNIDPPTLSSADIGLVPVRIPFYDFHTGKLHWAEINMARLEAIVSDPYSKEGMLNWLHDQGRKDRIGKLPRFRVVWDPRPTAPLLFDGGKRIINTYKPTQIEPTQLKKPTVPVTIQKIIRHALNNKKGERDLEYEHFLDWLAFIVRERDRSETAWLLHGGSGTGKGVVFHGIMLPLVRRHNTGVISVKSAGEKFTDSIDGKLLAMVDEVSQKDIDATRGFHSQIKSWITEPTRPQRLFGRRPTQAPNFINFYFTSNDKVPIRIGDGDRRFNIAPAQPDTLEHAFGNSTSRMRAAIDKKIPLELPEFYQFLMQRKTNKKKASTALMNETKQQFISASMTATDKFFKSLKIGDLSIWEHQYSMVSDRDSHFALASRMGNLNNVTHNIQQIGVFIDIYENFVLKAKGPVVLDQLQLTAAIECLADTKPRAGTAKFDSWLQYHGETMDVHYCSVRKRKLRGVLFNITPRKEK